jgi:AAA+ superfamily predicted ATPase
MSTRDRDPSGYERYVRDNDYRSGPEILLPTRLAQGLYEADQLRLLAEKEAKAAEQANEGAPDGSSKATDSEASRARVMAKVAVRALTKAEQALQAEQALWKDIDAKDAKKSKRQYHPVFASEQVLAFWKSIGSTTEDEKKRLQTIYDALLQRGTTTRQIATPKSLHSLEALADKQPHMKQVVQFVMEQITLAQHSRKPLRLQPMLIVGEAGVGKTHFAQALAKALATSVYVQPLDGDLTSSFLLGSDRKWSNTQHGLLFETLLLGQHANPVIVLDEMDKTQRSLSYGSPLQSLHSVLEPVSAKMLRDISLPFQFDASLVTWIATANYVVHLDAPLRSRFKEFHIMPPDAQECLVLAQEVMRSAIDSIAIKDFSTDVSLRRHMAHLPARQIWQLTREAMGRAVTQGRKHLVSDDLPKWLFEEASVDCQTPAHRLH